MRRISISKSLARDPGSVCVDGGEKIFIISGLVKSSPDVKDFPVPVRITALGCFGGRVTRNTSSSSAIVSRSIALSFFGRFKVTIAISFS